MRERKEKKLFLFISLTALCLLFSGCDEITNTGNEIKNKYFC